MERNELLAYLLSNRLGIVGTIAPSGEPQGALVGYAVTPDLEIIFDTLQTTRKYRNMTANPRVSFTVGNTAGNGDERTVQYEGVADEPKGEELAAEPKGEELAALKRVYFEAWPDGPIRESWDGITWFRVKPKWIRFSDFR